VEKLKQYLRTKRVLEVMLVFMVLVAEKLKKGVLLYEHSTIILKKNNERTEIDICKLVNIELNAFMGDINVRTNIKCFKGWNRRGLGNHIGKVLDLKNGIFKIYTNGEVEDLRSVWFHGDFDQVTAIYQVGFVDGQGLNFTSVETLKNLGLWQFRLRTLCC
jgi:hypothetical protein